ncbi:hypothetical protein HDU96_010249 [Phlyctochytrium bullatum]|nr:hypothetical protein HDU96_010249 [Phlyctochytrium bullatum]
MSRKDAPEFPKKPAPAATAAERHMTALNDAQNKSPRIEKAEVAKHIAPDQGATGTSNGNQSDDYGDDFEVSDSSNFFNDMQDYDEDFETYEETRYDNEEVDLPESIIEVRKALEEENKRALSHHPSEKSAHVKGSMEEKSSSIQNEVAFGRSIKLPNHADLKSLVELDFADYDVFDRAPMNEYDLYIRNFGTTNTRQTDDWFIADKWTQAPPEQLTDVGVGQPLLPWLSSEIESWKRVERRLDASDRVLTGGK